MINSINPSIIIGIVLIIILLFNLGLIAKLKQGSKGNKSNVYQSFLDNLKSPWQEEDAALDELSKLVETKGETDINHDDQKK